MTFKERGMSALMIKALLQALEHGGDLTPGVVKTVTVWALVSRGLLKTGGVQLGN